MGYSKLASPELFAEFVLAVEVVSGGIFEHGYRAPFCFSVLLIRRKEGESPSSPLFFFMSLRESGGDCAAAVSHGEGADVSLSGRGWNLQRLSELVVKKEVIPRSDIISMAETSGR